MECNQNDIKKKKGKKNRKRREGLIKEKRWLGQKREREGSEEKVE